MITLKEVLKAVIKELEDKYPESKIQEVFSKYNFEDMIELPNKPAKLLLKRLKFEGQKNTNGKEEYFLYDREIYPGVNIWVADNFSGKSSILNIIRWCLTGKNGLKTNVKKWIHKVMLEFEIRDKVFTMVLDTTSARIKGNLYQESIDQCQVSSLEDELKVEFSFRNSTELEERIQNFFMSNLGLSSLKWTQKSSSRDSLELYESSTSWSTYFKAMFMKSDEYGAFLMPSDQSFGSQTQKVLGMFLGLTLFKLQNRLAFRIDTIRYELAKEEHAKKTDKVDSQSIIDALRNECNDIINQRKKLELELRKLVDQSKMNLLMNELSKNNIALAEAEQRLFSKERELVQIERLLDEEESATIGLKEALHFKLFFNGIRVHTCPHCETKISAEKIRKEQEAHICSVCDEPLVEGTQDQMSYLQTKLDENHTVITELKKERKVIDSDIDNLKSGVSEMEKKRIWLVDELTQLSDIHVSEIEEQIKDLILKQGKIEGRIEELSSNAMEQQEEQLSELEIEKDVLSAMISKVDAEADILNQKLIKQLEESVKEWAIRFGIKSVTDVKIDSRLEPKINQDEEWEGFSDLADGEKLRLKISFFVQLMLLASQSGVGKHPQLLLIDSPGTSELIEKDFREIIDVFKEIDEDHSADCQILIASARQNLKNATHPTKVVVKTNGEPIF